MPENPEENRTREHTTSEITQGLLRTKDAAEIPEPLLALLQDHDDTKEMLKEVIRTRAEFLEMIHGDSQIIMSERPRIEERIRKIDAFLSTTYTEYEDLRRDLDELARDFLSGERDLPPKKPGQN